MPADQNHAIKEISQHNRKMTYDWGYA